MSTLQTAVWCRYPVSFKQASSGTRSSQAAARQSPMQVNLPHREVGRSVLLWLEYLS